MSRATLVLVVGMIACGDGGTGVVDGSTASSDASLPPADAASTEVDGGRGIFDAAPALIDASSPMIDGATPMIDASTPMIDASVAPDAEVNAVMTFFVTSTGNGANGGNLGGLVGADSKCQTLATNANAGHRTWRAYLSTSTPLVNARDRIGTGPWSNQQGVTVATNLSTLHGGVAGLLILSELGQVVPQDPLDHDILTGSTSDGNAFAGKTCADWTDGSASSGGQVGHADVAAADVGSESWNSSHDPQCSEAALNATAGTGRIYCFAID